MATNVKLSDDLVAQASRIATIEHRSIPKQIEFYFKIAAIAEENPELSFKLIKEILKADAESGSFSYKFG
jgi:predicted transcriptional regulator